MLTNMGPSDDVEAFLEAFERAAEAAGWPKEQWAYMVGLYLSGEAMTALKALEKADVADYDKVKQAVLDRYEITPEWYRLRLRSPTPPEGTRPRAVIARLKNAATRWLKPTTEAGRRIVELVVIEQLLLVLPGRIRHWLVC